MEENEVKHDNHHSSDDSIFLNHNCINEIGVRVRQYISLVAIPGAFSRNTTSSHRDARMLCLKWKLTSIHKIGNPVFGSFTAHAKLDSKCAEQYSDKNQHCEMFCRYSAYEHDQHTGK